MARRKSKARQEYDRLRKNLSASIRRAEKKGSAVWVDLPETPLQQGLKGTAKEYQKAITQLKKAGQAFRSGIALEKAQAQLRIDAEKDIADTVIDNFIEPLQVGDGGKLIKYALEQFRQKSGSIKTAEMLQSMADNNKLVGKAEIYNQAHAYRYVAEMGQEMTRLGMLSSMEWDTIDDAINDGYNEIVPDELQQ